MLCLGFFFYFLTKMKLICLYNFGLICGNAQCTQSKQTIPAAMGCLQRVAALGPGDPEEGTGMSCHSRPGTTGLCRAPSLDVVQSWIHRLIRPGEREDTSCCTVRIIYGHYWHHKLFMLTEEGQERAMSGEFAKTEKANHQGKPRREGSRLPLQFMRKEGEQWRVPCSL